MRLSEYRDSGSLFPAPGNIHKPVSSSLDYHKQASVSAHTIQYVHFTDYTRLHEPNYSLHPLRDESPLELPLCRVFLEKFYLLFYTKIFHPMPRYSGWLVHVIRIRKDQGSNLGPDTHGIPTIYFPYVSSVPGQNFTLGHDRFLPRSTELFIRQLFHTK
jgi:hypothetical protein